jgi:preprotein translocase subunit SecE
MNKLRLYIGDAMNELVHKVTWPTWSELQSSAIVVMIASLIIAGIIFVMDVAFQAALNFLYQMSV